jgi:hypothetical protein
MGIVLALQRSIGMAIHSLLSIALAFVLGVFGISANTSRWQWAPSPEVQRYQIATAQKRTMASATSFYDFKPLDSMFPSLPHPYFRHNLTHTPEKGQPVPLSEFKGKVVLVVNTASKCGFTPQYDGLEKLYKKVRTEHGDDFVILGFPCNQFGGQEPGTDDDIQSFCQINYGVSFPIVRLLFLSVPKALHCFPANHIGSLEMVWLIQCASRWAKPT